ncbi:hypothetical protein K402DRAFT_421626 [Aulographum hederae CBS 113979]|uniref:Uncharacterized protein n=1 Tax=Aulographum hederae CBS 113979 TaxID=1176131 RepID=A0A6G1GYM3_9PEZI|nr:hypothetical protein K402DRAFT_421626 [Aulographum hederae CBS 113979]
MTTPTGKFVVTYCEQHAGPRARVGGPADPRNITLYTRTSDAFLASNHAPEHPAYIDPPAVRYPDPVELKIGNATVPLDLGVFGPLEQKYSQQLQRLAAFTDGTDIKKNMFLDLYKKARIEGITSSNIKISFRTTGLWPFNPRKVLNSSQLNANAGNSTTEAIRSSSPLRLSEIHRTPKNPSEVNTLIDTLGASSSCIDFPAVKRKVTKFAALQSTQIAALEHQNAKQASEITNLRPQKRKGITIDPQKAFADI